jgi:hypothetical protein
MKEPRLAPLELWRGNLRLNRRQTVVEAAGVEREKREIGNLLMARDFWG